MIDAHSIQSQLCTASFNAVSHGLIVLDHEERVVMWNAWMSKHSNQTQAETLGRKLVDIFPELCGSRLEMAVTSALGHGHCSLLSQSLNKAPFPLFSPADSPNWRQRIRQAIQVVPLLQAKLARYCLIQISDVSLSVARERLLRDQAMELRAYSYIDSLTGIPNRRSLDEYLAGELQRAVRAATPLALIMLDIDYFKAYNDAYGHQIGDRCLMQVAAALQSTLKRPGDMVARYGGEEFVVVLVETNESGAALIAERLRARIEGLAIEHRQSKVSAYVTASLGVTCIVPGQACEPGMLFSAADQALYLAKHEGRNCVRKYAPELLCGVENIPVPMR